jgi:ornithine decarboxylase
VAWPAALTPAHLARLEAATPFLIVDCAMVEQRYSQLRRALAGFDVFYAVKCNPSNGILGTLATLGAGFEIASAPELDLVRAAGADPADVLYSNTVKPPAHVRAAWAAGVRRFAVDSEPELAKIAAHAPGAAVYVRVAVEDRHSLFPLSKKFGVPVDEGCRLLVRAAELGLQPYGMTFHVGSQCTDPRAWRRAVHQCGVAMAELARRRIRLEMLDLGGGFPARYVDPVPGLDEIAPVITSAVERLPYRPTLLCVEPGRFLVAESGVLAATVIGVNDRGGQRWAHLDVGGYNGLMEALQTGGRWRFPLLTSRADHHRVPHQPFTVTGPTCDSSDTVFYDAMLPATLAEGDRVYVGSTGAYTVSYASHFNGFPPPDVVYANLRVPAAVR